MKQINLAVILLVLALPAFAQSHPPFFLIAHRGGIVDSTNVENSLPALKAAMKKGYNMIEMDMRLTKDSVLIIQHDRNFKRYYGVDSNASDMTWERISRLVSDKGSKVVTLEEEFRNCQGKMQVMLDNKIRGNDTLLWRKIVTLLKKYDLLDNAIMIGTEESTPYFTGKIRLSCTRKQLEENRNKPGYQAAHYYLFGGVGSMTAEDVQWSGQQGIMVVGAVNLGSYRQKTDGLQAAARDIATLRSWGVTRFQIDSDFDTAFYAQDTVFKAALDQPVNPWTHLRFANKPEDFHFAIVSDLTNGYRKGVFEDAAGKLNGLMPEFVMSIGDMIEGYTTDTAKLNRQWTALEARLAPLKMPFFYTPGNHDMSNAAERQQWLDRHGKAYYHFVYKNVLFLVLDSNDWDGVGFSDTQIDSTLAAIRDNPQVRWTFLFMHHPVWSYPRVKGFDRVENALKDHPYTVIAGHTHHYLQQVRNGKNYYTLATTGGNSNLRGPAFGELDHIAWVSMTADGPTLLNITLDGMLPHDFSNERTAALTKALAKAVRFEPTVLLDDDTTHVNGMAQLTFTNDADPPLQVQGRFYHHAALSPSVERFSLTVPPHHSLPYVFGLQAIKGITAPPAPLSLEWKIGYDTAAGKSISLQGVFDMPLQRTTPAVTDTALSVFTTDKSVVLLPSFPGGQLRYTTDGADPSVKSELYRAPFTIRNTTVVKVRIYDSSGKAGSDVETHVFRQLPLLSPLKLKAASLAAGLQYAYYEGAFKQVPDFTTLQPLKSGITTDFNIVKLKNRQDQFAILFDGVIDIPMDGLYTFYDYSDDGSYLLIDGQQVVDNGGSHSLKMSKGTIALKKEFHALQIRYFEDFNEESLRLDYECEGLEKREIPFNTLYHLKK